MVAAISGSTCSSKPLCRSKSNPRAACGGRNSLTNSSRTRSALMVLIFAALAFRAAKVPGFDAEIQLRGKPHRPQQPQVVLGKPLRRRADRADDPGAQVRLAADPIVQLLPHRIVEQAIDGKVAPAGVGLRIAERNPFRVPAILVIRLGAEGGDLELLAAFDDDHYPELASDRDRALEEAFDLCRQGGGGDVVIPRLAAQQEIAHAAAHPEGREPGALQPADDGERGIPRRLGSRRTHPRSSCILPSGLHARYSSPQILLTCSTPLFTSSTVRLGLNSNTLMCSGLTNGLRAAKSIMPEPGAQWSRPGNCTSWM